MFLYKYIFIQIMKILCISAQQFLRDLSRGVLSLPQNVSLLSKEMSHFLNNGTAFTGIDI